MKNLLRNIFTFSKRKLTKIETDDGKEFVNRIFKDLLQFKKNKRYSRYTSNCAVFAERFRGAIGTLYKKPLCEMVLLTG